MVTKEIYSQRMKKNILFYILAIIFCSHLVNAQTIFGFTPGSFDVDETGNASYSIPIIAPAGINGMSPKLAIQYNSSAGNGLLGIGFSLQGFSVISRVGRSRTHDEDWQNSRNVGLGVTFDPNKDKFSIDGQRMVLAPESIISNRPLNENYGFQNTKYYTENQSFTKIELIDYINIGGVNHPRSFKAFTKDGNIYYYGNTNDSRVAPQGTTVPNLWLVNRIEDRFGNGIEFVYNNSNGEYRPTRINYVVNSSQGVTSPQSYIEFTYENRPDNTNEYFNGFPIKLTQRLKNIGVVTYTFVENAWQNWHIRMYDISYLPGTNSLVKDIVEKGHFRRNAVNLTNKPTTFTWYDVTLNPYNNSNLIQTPIPTGDIINKPDRTNLWIDIDGNGILDYAMIDKNGNNNFYLNDGTYANYSGSIDFSTVNLNNGYIKSTDFDANGKSDIAFVDTLSKEIKVWLSNCNSTNFSYSMVPININVGTYTEQIFAPDKEISFQDVQSDGLVDLICLKKLPNNRYDFLNSAVFLNNTQPNNSVAQTSLQLTLGYTFPAAANIPNFQNVAYDFVDLNNDGLLDIFVRNKVTGDNYIFKVEDTILATDIPSQKNTYKLQINNAGVIQNAIAPSNIATPANAVNDFFFMAANDDRLPDILFIDRSNLDNGIIRLLINKGNLTFETPISQTNAHAELSVNPNIFVADLDGEGTQDLIFFNGGTGSNKVFLNNGSTQLISGVTPINSIFPIDALKSPNQQQVGTFTPNSFIDFFFYNPNDGTNFIYQVGVNTKGRLLKTIEEGTGRKSNVLYSSLLNNSTYTRRSAGAYPLVELIGPTYVVSEIQDTYGTEVKSFTYKYEGAVMDVMRGFRGFYKTEVKDNRTGVYSKKFFDVSLESWKKGSPIVRTEDYSSSNQLLGEAYFTHSIVEYKATPNAEAKCFGNFVKTSFAKSYDFSGALIEEKKTTHWMDSYLNPTNISIEYGNGEKDSTYNIYSDNVSSWILGRLTEANVYRFEPTSNPTFRYRQSKFEYDATKGYLTKEIKYSNLTAQEKHTKIYGRDNFGNITSSTEEAWNGKMLETRTTTSSYDASRRFLLTATNALNQTVTYTINPSFGHNATITDPNTLTVSKTYDDLGRITQETAPDGTWIKYNYIVPTDLNLYNPPTGTIFMYGKESSNGQKEYQYFDGFERTLRKETIAFDGSRLFVDYEYNNRDLPIRESLPYFKGSTRYFKEMTYDEINRLTKVRLPDGRQELKAYNGKREVSTNYKNQRDTTFVNERGYKTKITNNLGQSIFYKPSSDGNTTITDPSGIVALTTLFDSRGYKISNTTPDRGTSRFIYNGFGEIIVEVTPRGDSVKFEYDKLGRISKKTQPEGITTYEYDFGNKGIGKIYRIANYKDSDERYIYDNFGRIDYLSKKVGNRVMNFRNTYDAQSRVLTLTYPNGFRIKNTYNSFGFLTQINRDDNGNTNILWKGTKYNHFQMLEEEEIGLKLKTNYTINTLKGFVERIQTLSNTTNTIQNQTFVWDDVGNLTSRKDILKNKEELFTFDGINRVTKSRIVGGATIDIAFDASSRISSRSDIGTYNYFTGTHKLSGVDLIDPSTCIPSFEVSFAFNSFEKVKTAQNDTAKIENEYDHNLNRFYQKRYINDKLVSEKYWFGNYEIELFANGKSKESCFISSPEGVKAVFIKESGKADAIAFFVRDHLKSIVAITDINGVVKQEFSYNLFGARRDPTTWLPIKLNGEKDIEYGYTGHLQLDFFDLIDMGGRYYDPVLGLFLSPDVLIQDITSVAAFNTYLYCGGNPISCYDPNGHFFKWLAKKWRQAYRAIKPFIGTIVAIAITVYSGGTLGMYAAAFVGGFSGSVIGTLVAGGNLGTALKAGLKSGVISAISAGLANKVGDLAQMVDKTQGSSWLFTKVVGHGITQGALSEATGGKFIHGFVSGGVSAAFSGLNSQNKWFTSDLTRVVASSVIGGTAAELGGGSFANGAVTGAFIELFNCLKHPEENKCLPESKTDKNISKGLNFSKVGLIRDIASGLEEGMMGAGEELLDVKNYNSKFGKLLSRPVGHLNLAVSAVEFGNDFRNGNISNMQNTINRATVTMASFEVTTMALLPFIGPFAPVVGAGVSVGSGIIFDKYIAK